MSTRDIEKYRAIIEKMSGETSEDFDSVEVTPPSTGPSMLKESTKTSKDPDKQLSFIMTLNEVAPPDAKIEKWIKDNKDRFVKQYGEGKGIEVLYGAAWNRYNKK